MRKLTYNEKKGEINANTAPNSETAPASGRNVIMNRNRGSIGDIQCRRCLRRW